MAKKKKKYTLEDLTKDELIKLMKEKLFLKLLNSNKIIDIISDRYFKQYEETDKKVKDFFKKNQPFTLEQRIEWIKLIDKASKYLKKSTQYFI